jgi:hypothetical protein
MRSFIVYGEIRNNFGKKFHSRHLDHLPLDRNTRLLRLANAQPCDQVTNRAQAKRITAKPDIE